MSVHVSFPEMGSGPCAQLLKRTVWVEEDVSLGRHGQEDTGLGRSSLAGAALAPVKR